MVKLLQSAWMTAVIGVMVFVLTLVLAWKQMPEAIAAPAELAKKKTAPFVLGNLEVDLLLSELQRRKGELDTREKQLNEYEARLKAEAAELSVVTQNVARVQQEVDKVIVRIKDGEATNLKKLAQIYSSMGAESAAAILRELDDAGLVKILAFMKEEDAARILEGISRQGEAQAKRVARLSESLRLFLNQQPAAAASTTPAAPAAEKKKP